MTLTERVMDALMQPPPTTTMNHECPVSFLDRKFTITFHTDPHFWSHWLCQECGKEFVL